MRPKFRHHLIAATIIILVLLPFKCAAPQTPDSTRSFLAGVRINNSLPYGTIGYITRPSPRFMIAYTGDLGGQQAALHPEAFLKLSGSAKLHLWLSLGPNLELIHRNIDTDDPVLYLSAITGASITYPLHHRSLIHVGFNYLTPAGPPQPWKIFLYLSAPLSTD